jgi:hypothetical protein
VTSTNSSKISFDPRSSTQNATGPAAAAINEWRKLGASSTAHYWRGRGKDFHLAKIEVPEAKRHATIKTLFPFVTFGVFEKPSFGDHATMNPVAVMIKLFVDGWAAFLDDKTMFDPRILLAIGNQAYIDGDFVINGVDYTENRKKSGSHQTRCWREPDSNHWSRRRGNAASDARCRFPRQRFRSTTIPERDRRFESTPLQRRVGNKPGQPLLESHGAGRATWQCSIWQSTSATIARPA